MGKTHDDDEIEIDLRELFFALKKRIVVILAALLIGAAAAGVYTQFLVTPMYRPADRQPADTGLQHAADDTYGHAGGRGQPRTGYDL